MAFSTIFFLAVAPARAQFPLAKDAILPIYVGALQPVATVRVAATRTEYQRRGFFRIGALPELVLENFRIEFHTNGSPLAAAQKLTRLLKEYAGQRPLRCSEVTLQKTFDGIDLLRAQSLVLHPNGDWKFQNGALQSGTNVQTFSTAVLTCSGPNAGLLAFRNGTVNSNVTLLPKSP